MARSRFSIGIDLGTTNCALAVVPVQGEGKSRILGIEQWESVSVVSEAATLPSYLYLPEQKTAAQMQAGEGGNEQWVIGRLAQKKAAETPGRVAHSAKSW